MTYGAGVFRGPILSNGIQKVTKNNYEELSIVLNPKFLSIYQSVCYGILIKTHPQRLLCSIIKVLEELGKKPSDAEDVNEKDSKISRSVIGITTVSTVFFSTSYLKEYT